MSYIDYTEIQHVRVTAMYHEVYKLTKELIDLGLTPEEAYYEISAAAGSEAARVRLKAGFEKKQAAGEP